MVNLYFDLPPRFYDALQRFANRGLEPSGKIIRDAYELHRPGPALELGCGTGLMSQFFNPGEYVGCDLDPARIEAARRDHPGYEFFVADATALEAETLARFSFIFCHAFMHHIDDLMTRRILERIEAGSRYAGRPIEMLIVEPLLPEVPIANPLGYALAKLDRGRFVRRDRAMRSLFGPTLYVARLGRGPWCWPIPGAEYRLKFGIDVPVRSDS